MLEYDKNIRTRGQLIIMGSSKPRKLKNMNKSADKHLSTGQLFERYKITKKFFSVQIN